MSKADLISIRPEWCELIASDEKTIELRKTKPNLYHKWRKAPCFSYGDIIHTLFPRKK